MGLRGEKVGVDWVEDDVADDAPCADDDDDEEEVDSALGDF